MLYLTGLIMFSIALGTIHSAPVGFLAMGTGLMLVAGFMYINKDL